VASTGSAGDPASVAITILMLVTAACLPAGLVGVVGWLRHAPALPLAALILGAFLTFFAIGSVLAFRPGKKRSGRGRMN
jgi:hypothetical protein